MVNQSEFTSLITKTFNENGLSSYLNRETTEKFFKLTVRMLEENDKYNLTAITDIDKIILNHYADCVTLAPRISKGAKIIDIGCGAGFPCIPLLIVRSDIQITAVDSTAKRINYVSETASMLGLDNVTPIVARAEDLAKDPKYREQYDYATARAVAQLRVLSELCLPFVKVGGEMIALKGKNAAIELNESKRAIAMLGGRDAKLSDNSLKAIDGEISTHPMIVIKKSVKTPDAYPRAFAQISKKPL